MSTNQFVDEWGTARSGDATVSRETHENPHIVVVRPDHARTGRSTGRAEAGRGHCPCVTAHECDHRMRGPPVAPRSTETPVSEPGATNCGLPTDTNALQ